MSRSVRKRWRRSRNRSKCSNRKRRGNRKNRSVRHRRKYGCCNSIIRSPLNCGNSMMTLRNRRWSELQRQYQEELAEKRRKLLRYYKMQKMDYYDSDPCRSCTNDYVKFKCP